MRDTFLLSKRVAEDLGSLWTLATAPARPRRMRSQTRLCASHVVNLFTEDLGNPQFPKKFQSLKKRSARVRWAAMTAALFALAAIIVGIAIFSRYRVRSTPVASEKSIAVLPFDNLSHDPENAYFSEGIQDEILTRLAKIAELKVISRTSTQRFKSSPGGSASDRPEAWRGKYSGGQRAKAQRPGAGQCAVNSCRHRHASMGRNLRSQIDRCLCGGKRHCEEP